MTPQQRRHLSTLIDESRYAMLDRGLALYADKDARDRAAERTSETYRAVLAYLDEITDYSKAEAVSGR